MTLSLTRQWKYTLNVDRHQVFVASLGGVAAFANRPHDQRLASAAVAGSKDARNAGFKVRHVGRNVRTLVSLQTKGFDKIWGRAQEAQR